MSDSLLIVLLNTDPRNVEELSAPFYHAAVAAAMDYAVDVFCTGTAARLMCKGVAEQIIVKAGKPMTVYDWIKEAHEQGARFWTCPTNLENLDMTADDLIPECQGMMGAATMIKRIMDGDCRTLTY
jgi:predicted peroxiredoxin